MRKSLRTRKIQRYNTNNRRIETLIRIPRGSSFHVISIGETWKGGSKIEKESPELRDNLYRKRAEDLAEAGAEPSLCENERVHSARGTRPN